MSGDEAMRDRAAAGQEVLNPPKPDPTPAEIKAGEFVDIEQWRMDSHRDNNIDLKKALDDIDDGLFGNEDGKETEQPERQAMEDAKIKINREYEERKAEIDKSYQTQRQQLLFRPTGALGSEFGANPY